ncbi:MAG: hypothetical protein ABIJ57_14420 [Pseudomonadota bacterium]
MPNPNPGETEQAFVSRCIPVLIGEGRKQEQAVAICYSMYRETSGHAKAKKHNEQKNRRPE